MTKKYSREALINSKLFSRYQKDFLAAILVKDFYTINEAKKEINKIYKEDEK